MSKTDIIHARRCDCTEDNIGAACFGATVRACAEVKDLKARLRAARDMTKYIREDGYPWDCLNAATDLRVKNWRKP